MPIPSITENDVRAFRADHRKLHNIRGGVGILVSHSPNGVAISAAPQPRSQQSARPEGVYPVLNNSGADRDKYDILGLDGSLYDAATDLDKFQNSIGFKGIVPAAPDHYGKWGVLVAPVKAGERGLIRVSGVAVCRIHINDITDLCAGITDGDPTLLQSAPIAVAQILATSVNDGVTWGVVRLGTTIETQLPNCE